MNTSRIIRRVALTTAVAGAAALTAGPALAKPGPIDYGSLQQSAPSAEHASKAQVEHEEATLTTTTTTAGLAQQIKARVEQLERATADQNRAGQPTQHDQTGSSGSSVPGGAALALLGVALAAGAGGVVVYRFRHHDTDGRVGAATV